MSEKMYKESMVFAELPLILILKRQINRNISHWFHQTLVIILF